MTALIDAFQEIDVFLAHSIATTIEPLTLLEDIEAGSLRVWLRNVLNTVDDESLKTGEWKKVVGAFLVRAKRIIINWTEERTEVISEEELTSLQQSILNEAAATEVLRIPMYNSISTRQIAQSVELVSNATKFLGSSDSIKYLSGDSPAVNFNQSFNVVPGSLTELLVHESLTNEAQMILMVKKPDFLGDSKWEFRHGTGAIIAKMLDIHWLGSFRHGGVALLPGDALRAEVRSTVRYGYDGDVIDLLYEVTKVIDVIRAIRPIQRELEIDSPKTRRIILTDPE